MTKINYYCDRCNNQIGNPDLFGVTLKMYFEKDFRPHSNRAEKFIDRWSMDSMLLCSECVHEIIDCIIKHEG